LTKPLEPIGLPRRLADVPEWLCRICEHVHRGFAVGFTWFFTRVWRLQGKLPLNVRFSCAFATLAAILAFSAWLLPEGAPVAADLVPLKKASTNAVQNAAGDADAPNAPQAGKPASSVSETARKAAEAEAAAKAAAAKPAAPAAPTNVVAQSASRWGEEDDGWEAAPQKKTKKTGSSWRKKKEEAVPTNAAPAAVAAVLPNAPAVPGVPVPAVTNAVDATLTNALAEAEYVPKWNPSMSGGYLNVLLEWPKDQPDFIRYLAKAKDKDDPAFGHIAAGYRIRGMCLVGCALCVLAALLAFVRKGFVYRLFQVAWAGFVVFWYMAFNWTITCGSIVNAADNKAYGTEWRDDVWAGSVFALMITVIPPALTLIALLVKKTREYYRVKGEALTKDAGDRIIADLKTGGSDPRFRTSFYWAIGIFLAILILPYLLFLFGWEEPYGLPKGGGEQLTEVQVVKKKPKKEKKKKLMVNPFSPYILERMNIDDVKTLEELNEQTMDTYVATATTAKRKGGKGKGTGGWPQGLEGSSIRFIRLKYSGGDWDQDMGKGADYNLLLKFYSWTGMKVARDTEFREIPRLKMFPKHRAPPFVFMTGMKGINLSEREVKVLRWYCLEEGGMLFIDNGGGNFGSAVRQMIRRVFPGKGLVDIPNDDKIFQEPYIFPDGAPPFWHHDGHRALGVRDEGRWCVFYHPGDVNDAWKDDHSGASDEVADQAYKLGVNIMYYAFCYYYHRHFGDDVE